MMLAMRQEFDGSDSGARPDEAISWGKIKIDAQPVKVRVSMSIVFIGGWGNHLVGTVSLWADLDSVSHVWAWQKVQLHTLKDIHLCSCRCMRMRRSCCHSLYRRPLRKHGNQRDPKTRHQSTDESSDRDGSRVRIHRYIVLPN